MRYIFMDEAGTSALEPVTVVVAIIADADAHLMNAEALVCEALGGVPSCHKENFVFHATKVFGDRKYQSTWSMTDRINLLKTMMSIPRKIGMGIIVSAHWRNSVDYENSMWQPFGMSKCQFEHFMAFSQCIAVADRNIRKHAGPREVGSVVAEDLPEMRKFLKIVPKFLRDNPYNVPPDLLRRTAADEEAGYLLQSGDLRVTRIRNSVHFVEKDDDPLVQVADACAYGIRRFFSKEKFGEEFADAIIGNRSKLRNFGPPMGAEAFWFTNIAQDKSRNRKGFWGFLKGRL